MKKQHIIATVISLLVLSGVIGLSACAGMASASQKSGLDAHVGTAVAATLVQYMIETEVAAQSGAVDAQAVAQVQATNTPLPTPTQVPTATPVPTDLPTAVPPQPTPTAPPPPTAAAAAAPAAASGPKIVADEDTNCRVGPGTGYTIETYFLKGDESVVQGRDQTKDWWYIIHPSDASQFCWVWEGSTTVFGDTSSVPTLDAPAADTHSSSNSTYYGYYGFYNPYYGSCYYGNNACGCGYYDDGCGYNCGYNGCVNYYPNTCKPNKWWKCNPYVNCTCKPVYHNPCKKSSCPPVTEVNYKNYCKKYPQCCD